MGTSRRWEQTLLLIYNCEQTRQIPCPIARTLAICQTVALMCECARTHTRCSNRNRKNRSFSYARALFFMRARWLLVAFYTARRRSLNLAFARARTQNSVCICFYFCAHILKHKGYDRLSYQTFLTKPHNSLLLFYFSDKAKNMRVRARSSITKICL